jgi:glutamate dehydrogenase/leucine dehydrogenase
MQHRSITLLLLLLGLTLFQVTLANADEFIVGTTMDATSTTAKTSWPEVVGENGQVAKAEIAQATGFSVQVVPEGSMVTMDYRVDRVRIFVDGSGNVSKPPRIG